MLSEKDYRKQNYERFYIVHKTAVIVRKHSNINKGCLFEFSTDNKNWTVYPYIVCANSLEFEYSEFDNLLKIHKLSILETGSTKIVLPQPNNSTPIVPKHKEPPQQKTIPKIVLSEQERLQQEIDKIDQQLESVKSNYNQWRKIYDKRCKLQYQLNNFR